MSSGNVGVPRGVPGLTNAHSAGIDLDVKIGSTIVDQDVKAAVLRGDVLQCCVDGGIGAEIDLEGAEVARRFGDLLLHGFDGGLALADCAAADDQFVRMRGGI